MGIKKGKGNLGMKDYKDYRREMAAKGELHALDTASGGLFGLSKPKRRKNLPSKSSSPKRRYKETSLPVWQDRNRDNIGSKLNG